MSESGALNVHVVLDTSGFRGELERAQGAFMDLLMRLSYRFALAGEDDGTAWGEWEVFV